MNLVSQEYLRPKWSKNMDDNSLLSDIFETRFFDTTRCRLLYLQNFYCTDSIFSSNLHALLSLHFTIAESVAFLHFFSTTSICIHFTIVCNNGFVRIRDSCQRNSQYDLTQTHIKKREWYSLMPKDATFTKKTAF